MNFFSFYFVVYLRLTFYVKQSTVYSVHIAYSHSMCFTESFLVCIKYMYIRVLQKYNYTLNCYRQDPKPM